MSMKLYLGNLAFQTSRKDLQKLFSDAPTLELARATKGRGADFSRDVGFVEVYAQSNGAEAQIKRYLAEIAESRKRARRTQIEINRLKRKTNAVLEKLP